jgi:hypothetical protein
LGILFLINTIESSITIANKGKIIKAGNSETVGVGEGEGDGVTLGAGVTVGFDDNDGLVV